MTMDFILSDCCYKSVGDIIQPQNNGNQETENCCFVREAFKVNENQPLPDENEFMNFWNKNYQNYYENIKRNHDLYIRSNGADRKDFNELDEILNHVPRLPSHLQGIGGKKMNFIMVATTLDETTIVEKLQRTLDKTESHTLPLSFKVQSVEHINDGNYGNYVDNY